MSTPQPIDDLPASSFPTPPLSMSFTDNQLSVGEPAIVMLRDGRSIIGQFEELNFDHTYIRVRDRRTRDVITVSFDETKLLHLPTNRDWEPISAFTTEYEGVIHGSQKQSFELIFKDGDNLVGETYGIKQDVHGRYIFPVQPNGAYINCFVPHDAIETCTLGKKMADLLVDEAGLSARDINEALATQEHARQQPLGEYFRLNAVVTSQELEKALELQQSAPNLRLGEVLVGEGLITREQLEQALATQSESRALPLGEILVEKGLITSEEIQRSMAKKLAIPFVNLQEFEADQKAAKLVPEDLARRLKVVPIYTYDNKLVVAMENPMDGAVIESIRFHTNNVVEPVMASATDLHRTLNLVYSLGTIDEFKAADLGDDDEEEEQDLPGDNENLVVKTVYKLIVDAYRQDASDLHIEPYKGKQKTVVRIRKDGTLVHYYDVPAKMSRAVISRIKIMAGLDISERRKPQDGKIEFQRYSRLPIELRVSTIPTAGGNEDVTIRILESGAPLPLGDLGLSEHNRARLDKVIDMPHGLIFVCGPTGSGKTTTLHSILNHRNKPETKIWTAEDPIEITQHGLRQVQVNPKIGFDFAAALRAFLRADPDIIMVGEMRDTETAKIGIEASLTGHLVLTTLHTNSAPESITRLLEMGMDPFSFQDAMLAVLAQRLTKRLCPDCKRPYIAERDELMALAQEYRDDTDDDAAEALVEGWRKTYGQDGEVRLFEATGCKACDHSGYRGRIGLHELLLNNDDIRKLIAHHATVEELRRAAFADGMRSLKQDGIEKILVGHTDIHQVRRVSIR